VRPLPQGWRRFLEPALDVERLKTAPRLYRRFARELRTYRELAAPQEVRWRDAMPMLHDRTESSPYDPHYFFQDTWAARRIVERGPARHIDVGSRVDFVGFLTTVTQVTFVDLRPLDVALPNLEPIRASILELPFEDASVDSLSCLHVAEHVGLGRYGDPLDPNGTEKAAAELQRVLAPEGELLFSVPIGRHRVCFNAHRIHTPQEVIEMFPELSLEEFAAVTDDGSFGHFDPNTLDNAAYACGLFRFQRVPAGA
jgi:SAM-dependent methyltransferase